MDPGSSHGQSVNDPAALRANFLSMSIYFAIGHGCCTTPLVYATSVLDSQVAYIGNATLYVFMLVSALILAVPAVDRTGLKGGMVASYALYAVYVGFFSFAGMATETGIQGLFFITGSICGGTAAGVLWTAQGGYMAKTAAVISEVELVSRESLNSELTTHFAFYFLLIEVVAKVAWTGFMVLGLSVQLTGFIYAVLTMLSMCGMTQVIDLESAAPKGKPVLNKLLGTVELWSDMRIWLLSPTNITFGLAAAYMNGYFNANIASKELGQKYIGILAAFTVIISSAVTKTYGFLGQRYGNIVPISIGAASFASIPILMIAMHCCNDFGWWLLIFYALQGSGRAVYESANKAIFADAFRGEQTEGAFANCVLQMSLSSAVCFFASAVVQGDVLQKALLVFALLTPVAYIAKTYLDPPMSDEAGPLLEKSA
jgi:hypothetical protein